MNSSPLSLEGGLLFLYMVDKSEERVESCINTVFCALKHRIRMKKYQKAENQNWTGRKNVL